MWYCRICREKAVSLNQILNSEYSHCIIVTPGLGYDQTYKDDIPNSSVPWADTKWKVTDLKDMNEMLLKSKDFSVCNHDNIEYLQL